MSEFGYKSYRPIHEFLQATAVEIYVILSWIYNLFASFECVQNYMKSSL